MSRATEVKKWRKYVLNQPIVKSFEKDGFRVELRKSDSEDTLIFVQFEYGIWDMGYEDDKEYLEKLFDDIVETNGE